MIYFIADGDYVKIGKAGNVNERLRTLQTGNPRTLALLKVVDCSKLNDNYTDYDVETELHAYFNADRISNANTITSEWFPRSAVQFLIDMTEIEITAWLNNTLKINGNVTLLKVEENEKNYLRLKRRLEDAEEKIDYLTDMIERKNKTIGKLLDELAEVE